MCCLLCLPFAVWCDARMRPLEFVIAAAILVVLGVGVAAVVTGGFGAAGDEVAGDVESDEAEVTEDSEPGVSPDRDEGTANPTPGASPPQEPGEPDVAERQPQDSDVALSEPAPEHRDDPAVPSRQRLPQTGASTVGLGLLLLGASVLLGVLRARTKP